ncbi:MAG TPA: hypothetical protein VN921_00740 [Chthoniobacterales bacterium]|nr:hypothetical protein [Chthoniobacterales bacterium]
MIEQFVTALSLIKNALGLVKDAKEILPESKKPAVEAALAQAEQSVKIAEAQMAEGLGYFLCKCTWPPQIALQQSSGAQQCPKCGRDVLEDFKPYVHPHFRQ